MQPSNPTTATAGDLERPKPYSRQVRPAAQLWQEWQAYCKTDDQRYQDIIEWLYYNATPDEVALVMAAAIAAAAHPSTDTGGG